MFLYSGSNLIHLVSCSLLTRALAGIYIHVLWKDVRSEVWEFPLGTAAGKDPRPKTDTQLLIKRASQCGLTSLLCGRLEQAGPGPPVRLHHGTNDKGPVNIPSGINWTTGTVWLTFGGKGTGCSPPKDVEKDSIGFEWFSYFVFK